MTELPNSLNAGELCRLIAEYLGQDKKYNQMTKEEHEEAEKTASELLNKIGQNKGEKI